MFVFASCNKDTFVNQHKINDKNVLESTTSESIYDKSIIIKAMGQDYVFQGYDKLDEHERNAIIAQAQDDGLTVSFEGNVMVVEDEDGNTVRFGAEKSENDKSDSDHVFLNGILPQPKDGTVITQGNVSSNECTAVVTDLSLKQVKAYIRAVEKAGYNVNTFLDEGKTDGLFLFSARNKEGNEVEISYRNEKMMIDVVIK